MANYFSKVQIDGGTPHAIGSSLYGECTSQASAALKVVTLADFDTIIDGVTIHVKFTNGNTATANPGHGTELSPVLQLQVGSTIAKDVSNPAGPCNWVEDAVISFTYDGTYWAVNDAAAGTVDATTSYNSNSTAPISGQGVAAALQTLDGNITGTPGADKTITIFSQTDGIVTVTFSDISITKSQVSGLGAAADKGVVTSIIESGENANKTSTDLPTTDAVTSYIDSKTAGLTGAMHFKGTTTGAMIGEPAVATMYDGLTENTIIINNESYTAVAGDVILYSGQEYVWTGTAWEILGDEGSYALKSRQATLTVFDGAPSFTQNTLPSLTVTPTSIPVIGNLGSLPSLDVSNVTIPYVESVGTTPTAVVESGVFKLTTGSAARLGTAVTVGSASNWYAGAIPSFGASISVGSASDWDAGSQASLSIATKTQTVVIP